MHNTFGLKQGELEKIRSIISTEQNVEDAFIFGSRAKGNYKAGSDVDIALKGKGITCEMLTSISYLLNEETAMPYKFDLLNYDSLRNKELKEHIDRVGISIFYPAISKLK
ncbi:MAG: nucleotidyltransferase family protein [Ilyomonas sp.]